MGRGRGRSKTPFSGYCLLRSDERLRDIIQVCMDRDGYTYKSLAEELDLNESNLREYVRRGKKVISQHNVLRIAHKLGLSVTIDISRWKI